MKKAAPLEAGPGRGMRFLIVLVVVLTACTPATSPSPRASIHVITGNLELTGSDAFDSSGSVCAGTGGYSDMREGAQITVKDDSGAVIGTGSMEAGRRVAADTCTFALFVGNVPDATFYSIEVSHRGELTYSAAEMETKNWRVHFTLGD